MFIAHRGKVVNCKENSIEAFTNAINDHMYTGFELDIRESSDGHIVVVHDFLVGNKLVSKQTLKELKEQGIIELETVLKLKTDKIILIEIKDFNMNLKKLAKLLNQYADKNIYLMSFNNKTIKRFLEYDHTCKCGILNYIFNKELSYNEYDFICLLNNTLTDNLISYFHKRKIEVFSYGIISNYINLKENVYYIIDAF